MTRRPPQGEVPGAPPRKARRAARGQERGAPSLSGASRHSDWVLGFHAVLGVLESRAAGVEIVLVGEGTGGGRVHRILQAARQGNVRTRLVPRRELDELADGVAHNGFAARVAPVPFTDPDELLERTGPMLLLGLDGLEDGHNLGAAARVAASFSLGGVVISGPHPPPLGGAAAKVAAGTLSLVPIAHVGAMGDFARRAKEAGFWVFGADARGDPVDSLDLPERLLLCIGAESGGLRAKTRAALDALVSIPIAASVESLNLSVAAGILAWEWRRRRAAAPGR